MSIYTAGQDVWVIHKDLLGMWIPCQGVVGDPAGPYITTIDSFGNDRTENYRCRDVYLSKKSATKAAAAICRRTASQWQQHATQLEELA